MSNAQERKPQTIEDAIDAVANIVNRADNELLISTGDLHKNCYESEKVFGALERAKKRGVEVFVLSGPIDPESTRVAELLQNDIFLLLEEPNAHFTIADGKHLRLEKQDPRSDGVYQNELNLDNPLSGAYLREKFFDALTRASKYSKRGIIGSRS